MFIVRISEFAVQRWDYYLLFPRNFRVFPPSVPEFLHIITRVSYLILIMRPGGLCIINHGVKPRKKSLRHLHESRVLIGGEEFTVSLLFFCLIGEKINKLDLGSSVRENLTLTQQSILAYSEAGVVIFSGQFFPVLLKVHDLMIGNH